MTAFLAHYPTYGSPPVGVWWWSPDGPRSYYLPGNGAAHTRGVAACSATASEAAWSERMDRLAGRTPNTDGFEEAEFADSVSPETALGMLRRVSAA